MPNLDMTVTAENQSVDVKLSVLSSNIEHASVLSSYPQTVMSGTEISLNASPAPKYIFTGWFSGDLKVDESSNYSFKIKKDDVN